MEKIVFIMIVSALFMRADTQTSCLACHQENQIPSELIYKRYLMQYSTDEKMQKVMYAYLKNPQKERSIMPSVFFSKFPMKEASALNDRELKKEISAYLKHFNLKKKLTNSR